jgi:hypothetical protein
MEKNLSTYEQKTKRLEQMCKENEIVFFAMDSRSISERMDCGIMGKYATHWRYG